MFLQVSDRIFQGIIVDDISLGGLTVDSAITNLDYNLATKIKDKPVITLNYNNKTWEITADDIDLKIDIIQTAHNSYNVGRTGTPMAKRMLDRITALYSEFKVPYVLTLSEEKLNQKLLAIANEINKPALNATLSVKDNVIINNPEQIGQKIDLEKLKALININTLKLGLPKQLSLTVEIDNPKITTASLKEIDTILAMYHTNFNLNAENRNTNIKLAAQSLNNILLHPNEIASFDKIVGPRIAAAGFKEAPSFINGKLVPDIGGGVCQVTSTLYNVALLANLEIVERLSHFRPPSYVPIGLDATVANGLIDFKFKNNKNHALYIVTQISNDTLSIYLLGNKEDLSTEKINIISEIDAVLEPTTLITQDPTLPLGTEIIDFPGAQGYKVSAYKITSVDGIVTNKFLLHNDVFEPEEKTIRVGTQPIPPPIAVSKPK